MNDTFYGKVGCTATPIKIKLKTDGKPMPLPQGTIVKFVMALGVNVKVNAVAEILSRTSGDIEYNWHPSDVDTAGIFRAECHITLPDGRKTISPINDPRKNFLTVILSESLIPNDEQNPPLGG